MHLGNILGVPSAPAPRAFVSYDRLTNQHLTFANQVSTRDKLVKDKKKGRGVFLNNHVAQDSFYGIELASNLTKPGKLGGN